MACVFVSTFPQKAFAQNTPGDLEQAKNLFDFGDCEGAVVILKTIANAQNVDDEKTLVSANRMLVQRYSFLLGHHNFRAIDPRQELLWPRFKV